MLRLIVTAALLATAASGCNRPPAPTTASHPPAIDLVCPPEPAALTDEQIMADPTGALDRAFNDTALLNGRACRDALERVCEWHRDRGAKGLKCEVGALSARELDALLKIVGGSFESADRDAHANEGNRRGKG